MRQLQPDGGSLSPALLPQTPDCSTFSPGHLFTQRCREREREKNSPHLSCNFAFDVFGLNSLSPFPLVVVVVFFPPEFSEPIFPPPVSILAPFCLPFFIIEPCFYFFIFFLFLSLPQSSSNCDYPAAHSIVKRANQQTKKKKTCALYDTVAKG